MTSDIVGRYAAASADHPERLTNALVRTKSRAGRDVLAALASGGRATSAELEDVGRAYRQGRRPADTLNLLRVRDLARVVALQTTAPGDRAAALGLFQLVLDQRPEALGNRELTLVVQLAIKERDFALADSVAAGASLAEGVARQIAADLANPWIRGGEEARWVDALNGVLFGPEVAQAVLLPSGDTPFDRLTTAPTERIDDARKITVVISCYNPDRHLLTAVRSVLEQTWQNLELFVVDDASPAPLPGILEQVEGMDPRVTVIRKALNGGTYRARNTALRRSTGDFFTCLDSDDWAHPQRLELGVRPLLEDESLVATRSKGVRATEQMELTRVGYGSRFNAASSLMVRTFPVVNRVGFFDPVRKAADNEYALRVEAAFNGRVVDVPGHALTVLLADEGSLSASDYSPGWRHPARAEYAASYAAWHRDVQWRKAPMFLPPHGRRPFPAPRRWERHPQDGPPGPSLDAVVVADWRVGVVSEHALDGLAKLLGGGRRVGVVHHESLTDSSADESVAPPVRDLIHRGEIERLYLDDARHSSLTVVADPRVMQFPPLLVPRLTSGRVVVVEDRDATGQYARSDVDGHVRELLGAEPVWVDGPWPEVVPASPVAVPAGTGSIRFIDGGEPVVTGDLELATWPLRESADGERGARLVVVRRVGAAADGAEVRELSEAWAAGDRPWEQSAADWLRRCPGAWAVAVERRGETVLVVAADTRADLTDAVTVRLDGPAEPGHASELLVWREGDVQRRPAG